MPEEPQQTDISPQARSIARIIDRFCRRPGRYTIRLVIPAGRREAWQVEIDRAEPLKRIRTKR